MSRAVLWLGLALALVAAFATSYGLGRASGRALERAAVDAQALIDLTALIDTHKDLLTKSASASRAMREALSARARQDAKTTEDFNHAIALNASSRDGCVFDAGVMRQLNAARERAAAAAASGLRADVPSTATGAGR